MLKVLRYFKAAEKFENGSKQLRKGITSMFSSLKKIMCQKRILKECYRVTMILLEEQDRKFIALLKGIIKSIYL